ncbi:MAG: hypothetical protein EHM93_03480 [Bacteroidales bacterium]|nr:MAG: hypothetical protein EHM93_03480 [Bacteroidales bacterium]
MSISSKNIIFFLTIVIWSCKEKQHINFSTFSPENNLAYNDGFSLYPNPLESDNGWGSAPFKWHIVDGLRTKANYWNYGLGFTGGKDEYIDTCGWRQATINFGKPISYNRVVIWLNTSSSAPLPDSFRIMHWNDQNQEWMLTKEVKNKLKQVDLFYPKIENLIRKKKLYWVAPYEEIFPSVKSSKVKFMFNNCGMEHGWINEFEVYNDSISEQGKNLVVNNLLQGFSH